MRILSRTHWQTGAFTLLASLSSAQATDCGYQPPEDWMADLRAAVARGEIADPATRTLPPLPPSSGPGTSAAHLPCLSREHIFAFEDTGGLLLTNFSTGALLDLMTDAANALMATHGDLYDFIGYWVNFTPDHTVGAAFYAGIENDVSGIGQSPFNNRAGIGLAGDNVEGYIMMWDINSSFWDTGTGPSADFTRLALAQEFEHRFAMFLPGISGGRALQGNNGACGRGAHWNWRVDGQGSGMEISEWVGSSPAQPFGTFVTFNTDIAGGVFSHPDLYLMGYESASEMDANTSELRYMNSSDCANNYNGTISTFSSADIIASAGPRVPDSTSAQKDFRTGWIMIHQPGAPPTNPHRNKAIGILEQHQIDWDFSTLGRGVMDNSLFDDCNCNGVPDVDEALGSNYCTGAANSAGAGSSMGAVGSDIVADNDVTLSASDAPPGVSALFYFGTSQIQAPFGDGFRCVGGSTVRIQPPLSVSGGGKALRTLDLASAPALGVIVPGADLNFQLWYRDQAAGMSGFNTSDGLNIVWQ